MNRLWVTAGQERINGVDHSDLDLIAMEEIGKWTIDR